MYILFSRFFNNSNDSPETKDDEKDANEQYEEQPTKNGVS